MNHVTDRDEIADIAASFQEAVIDCLVGKAELALEKTGYRTLCVGGGVAANGRFRERLEASAASKRLHASRAAAVALHRQRGDGRDRDRAVPRRPVRRPVARHWSGPGAGRKRVDIKKAARRVCRAALCCASPKLLKNQGPSDNVRPAIATD